MGKGAGKLNAWLMELPGGLTFIEFRNLRKGRLLYFFKKLNHKLKSPLKLVSRDTRVLTNAGVRKAPTAVQRFGH